MANLPPEAQQMMQTSPEFQAQIQEQVQNMAASLAAEMIEQYAQTVAPQNTEDPLVTIRKQELALKGADIERKKEEFERSQELDREKERNDALVQQQRIDISEEALKDKTRIAEERIQTQRDIAAMNNLSRRQ